MIGGAGTCGGFVVVGDWSGGFAGGAVRVGGVARGIVRQWFGAEGALRLCRRGCRGFRGAGGAARGIRGCILNDISFAEFWQVRFRYQTLGSLRKFQTVFFDLELSRVFSLSYLKIRWRIEKIKKSSKSVFAIALTF